MNQNISKSLSFILEYRYEYKNCNLNKKWSKGTMKTVFM